MSQPLIRLLYITARSWRSHSTEVLIFRPKVNKIYYKILMGACGACKVKKIEGEVVYDDDVDCEDNFVYTCVARPAGRVVIEA